MDFPWTRGVGGGGGAPHSYGVGGCVAMGPRAHRYPQGDRSVCEGWGVGADASVCVRWLWSVVLDAGDINWDAVVRASAHQGLFGTWT